MHPVPRQIAIVLLASTVFACGEAKDTAFCEALTSFEATLTEDGCETAVGSLRARGEIDEQAFDTCSACLHDQGTPMDITRCPTCPYVILDGSDDEETSDTNESPEPVVTGYRWYSGGYADSRGRDAADVYKIYEQNNQGGNFPTYMFY